MHDGCRYSTQRLGSKHISPSCWDVPEPAASEHAQILVCQPPWVAIASLGTCVSLFFFLGTIALTQGRWSCKQHVGADFCCVTYTFHSTSLQWYENNGHNYISVVYASLSLCSMHKHSDFCCSVNFENSCVVWWIHWTQQGTLKHFFFFNRRLQDPMSVCTSAHQGDSGLSQRAQGILWAHDAAYVLCEC